LYRLKEVPTQENYFTGCEFYEFSQTQHDYVQDKLRIWNNKSHRRFSTIQRVLQQVQDQRSHSLIAMSNGSPFKTAKWQIDFFFFLYKESLGVSENYWLVHLTWHNNVKKNTAEPETRLVYQQHEPQIMDVNINIHTIE